jgi:uncharacterized protein involved in type VI secretion and phage assembly
VDDQFKKTTLEQYKFTVARISEAHEALKVLNPQFEALNKVIETFGWQGDVEHLEAGDDFKLKPDAARSKGQKIIELAAEFFNANNNQWTSLSDLYLYLIEKGVSIGGKNPNSNLSAHLSNSDQFTSERPKGWRMKPEAFAEAKATPAERLSNKLSKLIGPSDLVPPEDNSRSPEGPMRR